MTRWEEALVAPDATILDCIRVIDSATTQIVVVVDDQRRLQGTVTDGDIRRGILRGVSLDAPVTEVMNRSPHTARANEDRAVLMAMMRRDRLRAVPLVDAGHRVVGLEMLADLLQIEASENWVVLMAGGEGRRLFPLTRDVPKPLLKVGSKPILETIMDGFIQAGFLRFFLAVNYLADQVEAHFGDGSDRGVRIEYLREDDKLGTAGALRLLPERPRLPFLVMNGDILTNVDFVQVLRFHLDHRAAATMCVREHLIQVPYGVVEMDGYRVGSIIEKPVSRHFVNAGIYVLEPEVLDVIPPGASFDMPQVFEALMGAGRDCAAFPIREYWLDVGQMADFHRANSEFSEVFP